MQHLHKKTFINYKLLNNIFLVTYSKNSDKNGLSQPATNESMTKKALTMRLAASRAAAVLLTFACIRVGAYIQQP